MKTFIGLLSVLTLSALAEFPATADDTAAAPPAADSCSAFRLDWVTGGPFNPEPKATSSSDHAVCSGVEDRAACMERHKGDGQQHPYVITHDQGANGNCTFQAVAGVMNFDKSVSGGKPDVSPEFLAAQDCDNFLPGRSVHNTHRAISSYNHSGSCTREDLAEMSNGGELSETLETAYMKSTVSSVFGGTIPNANADSKNQICVTLSSHNSSPGALALADELGAITDKISSDKNAFDKLSANINNEIKISKDVGANSGTTDDRNTAKDRAAARSREYGRCMADKEFFGALCAKQVQTPAVPHAKDKEKVPADNFKTPAAYKELANACSATFNKAVPNNVSEDFIVRQIKGSADANTCVQAYMRDRLMRESVDSIETSGKPLIVDVSDATGLMGKSSKRSDIGHAMVLIGREKRGGQCGYWVRNSWGTTCPPGDPAKMKCDPDRPGNVWISSAALDSDMGVNKIFDVNP